MPEIWRQLAQRAAELLPVGCHLDGADPTRLHAVMQGETMTGMVPKRAAEFSAGRHAARGAMIRAGWPPLALPQGGDRAPLWPPGLVGSISHAPQACLAAVSERLAGLGLDLEPDLPMAPELAALVRHAADQVGPDDAGCDLAAAAGQGRAADPALLVFCAKEAAYKAQYPQSRQIFGPEALQICITGDRFTAAFTQPVPPFAAGDVIHGRITLCAAHVLALAWIQPLA